MMELTMKIVVSVLDATDTTVNRYENSFDNKNAIPINSKSIKKRT